MILGVGHHSPAIITVVIDRAKFRPCAVMKTELTPVERVAEYLTQESDGRTPVLLIEDTHTLVNLIKGSADLGKFKLVLFDSLDKLKGLDDVRLIDAELKNGALWQMHKILPDTFNMILAEISMGTTFVPTPDLDDDAVEATDEDAAEAMLASVAEDEDDQVPSGDGTVKPKSAKTESKSEAGPATAPAIAKPKSWIPKAGQVSGMVTSILSQLTEKDARLAFRRTALEYAAGRVTKRSFTSARKAAVKNGASEQAILDLQTELEGAVGEKLYEVYYDVAKYGTEAKTAISEAGADENEAMFLLESLPPGEDAEFSFGSPPALTARRSAK